nr:hypothetical protein [Tanacetum cinerariifolium]
MRALLPSTSRRTDIPEADVPPRKRACLTTPTLEFKVRESSAAGAARQPGPTESELRRHRVEQTGYEITDTWDEIVDTLMKIAPTTLEGTSSLQTQLTTTLGRIEILEARDPKPQEGPAEAGSSWIPCMIIDKMAPKKRTTRATPATTTTPTTTVTDAQFQALIDRGVAAALAERDANRSRNGDNSNDSGTGKRRQMTTQRVCTYTDFLKCQPMTFQGTEEVVGLTRWMPTYTERQAKNKRKFNDTLRNNQHQQQPSKRNNVARAYTVGPGDKKPYRGTKPLCSKCSYHHDGPCAPKCTNCKKIGHLARDCKGRPAAINNNNNTDNNNNQRAQGVNARGITYFGCGVQGYYKSDCLKLKNGNQEN